MKQDLGLNPWLSIWVKPRKTIRALIDFNVNYRFIVLCAIYGFQYMLQAAQFVSMGTASSLWLILLLAIILAIPLGYIAFNVGSFFVFLLGKLVKGKGNFKQVRAATYWSSVPMVITVVIWFVLMITHGNALFVAGYERGLMGTGLTVNIMAAVVQVVIGVWGFILFLHALGEVQGFSVWMALLNVFLSGLTIFILLFLVSWGVSAMTHVT